MAGNRAVMPLPPPA